MYYNEVIVTITGELVHIREDLELKDFCTSLKVYYPSPLNISMSSASGKNMRNLFNTLHKWKNAVRRVTHEALSKVDERNYGADSDVEKLFQGEVLRHSGESATLAGGSTEIRLTTENDEDGGTDETRVSKETTAREEHERLPFEEYDIVEECARLRHETDEPFYRGNEIWLRRRELWNQAANNNSIDESLKHRCKFTSIPKHCYLGIYKKLSIDDRPLKEPLNLQDAIKIIDVGWSELRKREEMAAAAASKTIK